MDRAFSVLNALGHLWSIEMSLDVVWYRKHDQIVSDRSIGFDRLSNRNAVRNDPMPKICDAKDMISLASREVTVRLYQ